MSTDAFVLPGPQDAERQVALSRDLRGRPVPEWDVSNGPFAASGGLAATLPAMSALLRAAAEQDSPLLPGDGPHAWARKGTLAWHSGALLRCGSLVVFSPDTGGVGVAHALGGIPGWGSRRRMARGVLATGHRRSHLAR